MHSTKHTCLRLQLMHTHFVKHIVIRSAACLLRKRRIFNPEPKLNFVADMQSEIERYEAVVREAAEEGIDMVEEEVNPSILDP